MSFNYEPITYGEIKEGEGHLIGRHTKYYHFASQAEKGDKSLADTRIRLGDKGSAFQTYYIRDDEIIPTLRSKPDVIDLSNISYISWQTIRNSQTFPRDYDFSPNTEGNVGYICGMSVPPIMIKRIVTRLIESGVFQ
jgi:DNA (cytosine-5)-methyltransferase 1